MRAAERERERERERWLVLVIMHFNVYVFTREVGISNSPGVVFTSNFKGGFPSTTSRTRGNKRHELGSKAAYHDPDWMSLSIPTLSFG